MRAPAAFIALALAAVVVAGCGDDGGDGSVTGGGSETTVTVTQPESTTKASGDETTIGETTTTSTVEDGAPPPADIEVSELTGFTSPTGNIGCYIEPSSVRCDIGDRDWKPPARPADCEFDYGQGIAMDAGGAPDFVCAGDTALGGGDALPYGQSIAAGLLRCESAESGMTCTDVETGRGFMLAKESYELF